MNTIEADYRCRIADIFVANGDPVEYGQPIFLVETV
jgi:biotin carboxyl carrier protein